jgi:L-ribulokinase
LQFIEDEALRKQVDDKIIAALSVEAEKIPIGETSLLATDWMNGRRTPDANQLVKGTITGINLGSSAPMIFKALVEATAYGSKAIVDRFVESGVEIDQIIALGGVAKKSRFVMQTLCDVLNMPIKVHSSDQTCAFGAAMFAAVNAGEYSKVTDAQKVMGQGFETTYYPNEENHKKYLPLYENYLKLGAWTEKELFNV